MAMMHIFDYIIFIVTILMSFSIGVYFACRKVNDSTESYLLANRNMNMIPIATSILVSFISANSLLGNPSEMYYFGASYYFMIIGWSLSSLMISFTIVPLVHPLKLVSIHEYFMLRYKTKRIVYLGTFFQTSASCFANGGMLFGPAIMLESMAAVPVWAGMLVLGLISTIYTAIGGFKAVIWSDVFQAVVIFGGLILVNILGTLEVGGVKEVWQIYYDQGRLDFRWDISPFVRSTVWGCIIGMFVNVTGFFGVSQAGVQRFCSLPTLREAQRSVWYSIPGLMIIVTLTCFSGVVAFAYFTKIGCDPLDSGQISNPNQILPFLIVRVLNYPGVPGVFMACVLCGSFSNLSSSYNSLSALIWDDVLKDLFASRRFAEHKKAMITRLLAFSAGVCATLAGFLIQHLGGTLIQISLGIASIAYLPIVILIVLGASSRRPSWKSAIIGAIVPSCLIAWLNVGSNLSGHVYKHLPTVTTNCSMLLVQANHTAMVTSNATGYSQAVVADTSEMPFTEQTSDGDSVFIMYKMFYLWYAPIGLVIGIVLGFLLPFIPGLTNMEEVDAKLLFPFVRKMLKGNGFHRYAAESEGTYVLREKNSLKTDETCI